MTDYIELLSHLKVVNKNGKVIYQKNHICIANGEKTTSTYSDDNKVILKEEEVDTLCRNT